MADKSTVSSGYVYSEARQLHPELVNHARRTPLEEFAYLSGLTKNSKVYLKLGKPKILFDLK